MANRIFDLQETKGNFQVKGIVSGTESNRFYTSKKTKNGKDFRAVNFGVAYDDKKNIYLNLNGMPQQNVYFSRRNKETNKYETKPVAWANRNNFHEDGWRMIGVTLGLEKTTDENGKTVNDRKVMAPYDACGYISELIKDDESVFVRGAIEFSSYEDSKGNVRRSIKYVPNQVSLCKPVDYSEYNDENKPMHDFTQNIVFMGIEKEKVDERDTGRFVVSAKIVTYSDIVDTEFIVTNAKLAGLLKKNLKPYNAITVFGQIEVSHQVEEVESDDVWGEKNAMEVVSAPTKVELVITGATPSTIDRDSYSEKNIAEAMKKIRNAKNAEQNFSGKVNSSDDWGTDPISEDSPW